MIPLIKFLKKDMKICPSCVTFFDTDACTLFFNVDLNYFNLNICMFNQRNFTYNLNLNLNYMLSYVDYTHTYICIHIKPYIDR